LAARRPDEGAHPRGRRGPGRRERGREPARHAARDRRLPVQGREVRGGALARLLRRGPPVGARRLPGRAARVLGPRRPVLRAARLLVAVEVRVVGRAALALALGRLRRALPLEPGVVDGAGGGQLLRFDLVLAHGRRVPTGLRFEPHARAWRNWQTRRVLVPVGFGPWRFDSSRPHQGSVVKTSSTGARSFAGGSETGGPRWTSATTRSPGASPRSSRTASSRKQAGVRQYEASPRAVAPRRIA